MFPLNPLTIAIIVVVVLVVPFSVTCIKIVPQAQAAIVERLGTYRTTWNAGLHLQDPLHRAACAQRRQRSRSRWPTSRPSPSSPEGQRDHRRSTRWSFFQIMDPKLYAYGVENPHRGHREPDRHHAAQHHRRPRAGPARSRRRDAINAQMRVHPGRGHRRLGHQGQPRGAEEHHAAGQAIQQRHGEADEGRARAAARPSCWPRARSSRSHHSWRRAASSR